MSKNIIKYSTYYNKMLEYYSKIGRGTICIVALSNFSSVSCDKVKLDFLKKEPTLFSMGLFFKSMTLGCIWPYFYYNLFTNPMDVLTYCNNVTVETPNGIWNMGYEDN